MARLQRSAKKIDCIPFAGLCVLLFCVSICCSPAKSSAQYRFDYWTTDNGLPQNTVRSIVQTLDGYLWFTTFDGLVRYDGVRFTVFDRSNTGGLSSNRFTCLHEDRDGTLWAGTEDGGLTCYRAGVFTSFTTADGLPDSLILGIQAEPEGGLLLQTAKGLVLWQGERVVPFTDEIYRHTQVVYFSPSGATWFYDEKGLHQFKNGRLTSYTLAATPPEIFSFYEDRNGALWVGAQPLAVYRIKDGKVTVYKNDNGLTSGTMVWAFCEDQTNSLWVGVLDGGLYRFQDDHFTRYSTVDGLSGAGIYALFADNEGTLWVGTSENGLNRLTQQFITTYSTRNGLSNDNVYPIFETADGELWIGAGPNVNLIQNGRVRLFGQAEGLRASNIQSLYKDSAGTLWAGSVGYFYRYDGKKFQLIEELSGDSKTVWAICEDREGNLWLGSDRELVKYGNGAITRYTRQDGLPGNDVKVIYEDRNGTLWFGTYGGIAFLRDGKFHSLTVKDGLASDRVRSIYEDGDGTLWFGTYDGGLSRYKDGKFTNFTIENGLFNNGVFQILEDLQSNFWISSNRGIYRVNKQQLNDFAEGKLQTLTCIAYDKQDGMLSTECNGGRQPAGIKARDGKLLFPSQGGVVVIDPKAVPFNPHPPPVRIESVSLSRNNIAFHQGVRVEPGQQNLEINYTGLSFIKPEQVRFKYRLEGYDADWIDAGTRRTAYFPYLPPGEYTFNVIAANSDSVWNLQGASFRVIVIAPVYQRWWFVSLLGLGVACLALLSFRLRVARLRKEHETREAFSRHLLASQETFSRQLLESQERERKRIAAELHDSLGQNLLIIKNRALLGLAEGEEDAVMKENLSEISTVTSQALEEVRTIAHNLRPYQIDRLGLTRALQSMLNRVADSSEIGFTWEVDLLDNLFSKEAEMNLYRIVQESLNNIIKHSGATAAKVMLTHKESLVHLQIQDNGRGFRLPADNAANRGGFGLAGIAERVRMLGGSHEICSLPQEGTSININLPLEQARNNTSQDNN